MGGFISKVFVLVQGTSRSHIVFAPFQGVDLVSEMTKDLEVVVVERRDSEENYHFVGSRKLEKMGSESSA